jgi:hypothetical protein
VRGRIAESGSRFSLRQMTDKNRVTINQKPSPRARGDAGKVDRFPDLSDRDVFAWPCTDTASTGRGRYHPRANDQRTPVYRHRQSSRISC